MPDTPLTVFQGDEQTIGYCRFVDGTVRAVRLDEQGTQYVLDDDCNPVLGKWLNPCPSTLT